MRIINVAIAVVFAVAVVAFLSCGEFNLGDYGSETGGEKKGDEPVYDYKSKPVLTDEDTVYITKTGVKYHRGDCPHLRKSKIPITKGDAKKKGYGQCEICRP
jgi:hypothetical protein